MLINEVCKKCRLTKKAIEYYAEQKLVQPETLENGYRNFSAADIEKLKKIAILRRLGLSIQNIKEVFDGGGQTALYKVANSHFLRTAGPYFPDSPGHIKRTAWDISRAEGTPPY